MGSGTGRTISLTFVLVIAAAGVWLVLTPPAPPPVSGESLGSQVMAVPRPGSATEDGSPPVSAVVPGACPAQAAEAVNPEQLVLTPYVTSWAPSGPVLLPSSPTGGPVEALRCFTRTPEGALYAIATTIAMNGDMGGKRFSGYRWNNYTPDLAEVSVGMVWTSGPQSGTGTPMPWTALWVDNDWQVLPPTKATLVAETENNLRTLTPWGGV